MGDVISFRSARISRTLIGSGHALERATQRGELVRLRRGAYAAAEEVATARPIAVHRARIAAARLAGRNEPVFSHESAAALLGIPIVGDWPARVHTTVSPLGSDSSAAVQRTRRALDPSELVEHADGSRTTSAGRTAIDLAATRGLLAGIIAISHVRAAGASLDAFAGALRRAGRFAGVRQVHTALARSTDLTESVLETLVLVRCQDFCFQEPELQRAVIGIDGREYRVDFAWNDGRIVLEADGRGKYETRAAERGVSIADVHWAEKRREDAIRPRCEGFIRVTWSEVWSGHELARRLHAAGAPRRSRHCLAVLTM